MTMRSTDGGNKTDGVVELEDEFHEVNSGKSRPGPVEYDET